MTEPDESIREAKPAPIPADTGSGEGAPTSPPGDASPAADDDRPVEIGGQKGPEPTRYGDWEGKGRCTDF